MSFTPLFAAGPVIAAHAFAALAAFVLGLHQIVLRKGSPSHRIIGYIWAILMLAVALSSFWIHDLRIVGLFSPIHILSIIVLINVPLAIWSARKGRIAVHRASMRSLFFFALITAGAFTLLPGRVMHAVIFGQ